MLSNVLQSFSALSTLVEDFHHELHECTGSRAPCISIVKSAQNTAPVLSNVHQNTAPKLFKVHQNTAPSFLCTRVLRLRPPPQPPLCRVDHLLVLLQSRIRPYLANVHRAVFGANVICNECIRRKTVEVRTEKLIFFARIGSFLVVLCGEPCWRWCGESSMSGEGGSAVLQPQGVAAQHSHSAFKVIRQR